MTTTSTANYTAVSTTDEEEHEAPPESRPVEHNLQNPSRPAEPPTVPSIDISPPPSSPSPPRTASTEYPDTSAVARPLNHSNSLQQEQRPVQSSENPPDNPRQWSLGVWKERMHGSFTPSLHDLLGDTTPNPTRRQYHHNRQRWRLWRLTIGEFFQTLALCVAYFVILYLYSKMKKISVPQRRIFNALTTGTSLLLGVNIAASLRSYAKLLRWRMLATCYRPLETFDLVMGCDSLMNVVKLCWKARNQRHKFLPSLTQILCFIWLLVHLAVTVLVGIIGLNYNLNNSPTALFTQAGNVSVLDLNALSTGNYPFDLAQVQQSGIRGANIQPLDYNDPVEYQQSYFSDGAGNTLYYFIDENPIDYTTNIISTRVITATASCNAYIVDQGQYGNLSYVLYNDGQKVVNESLPTIVGPGGMVVISKLNSTCGDRCVDITAFQAATLPSDTDVTAVGLVYTIPDGTYFSCNNTVPQVSDDTNPNINPDLLVSDLVGRMLAGSLGWSDLPPAFKGTAEYAVYTNTSAVSFGYQPGNKDMANLISEFTMGGIASMDNSPYITRKNVSSNEQPVVAQILDVQWRFAGAILGVIPFIHFWTLAIVIGWANKAIIKDDSHLAIAKVYHSFLRQLGDRGCLLRGDEIVEVLENPHVAYGWRPSTLAGADRTNVMHVDIFERGQEPPKEETPFREGWYNGSVEPTLVTTSPTHDLVPRRPYRDFDAGEYF